MSLSDQYNKVQIQQQANSNKLNSASNNLKTQQNTINNMLKQQQTLNESYNDSKIILQVNYYKYIGFILISILLVLLLVKLSGVNNRQIGGGNNFQKEAIFLFIIMILTSLFSKFNDQNYIYVIVSIILILYIYAKIKLYQ